MEMFKKHCWQSYKERWMQSNDTVSTTLPVMTHYEKQLASQRGIQVEEG